MLAELAQTPLQGLNVVLQLLLHARVFQLIVTELGDTVFGALGAAQVLESAWLSFFALGALTPAKRRVALVAEGS